MDDPADLMGLLTDEATRTLREMSKTKDLERRRIQSEITKNLCGSLQVFFDLMTNTMSGDIPDFMCEDDDEEEDDVAF